MDRPIFHRNERAYFYLAIDDQAQRHGLHAARGKTPAHLVPKEGGDFVSDEAIQHAARLLRVHEIFVDLARVFKRRLDRFGRDFVEHHPENIFSSDDRFAPGDDFLDLDGLLAFLLTLFVLSVGLFDGLLFLG